MNNSANSIERIIARFDYEGLARISKKSDPDTLANIALFAQRLAEEGARSAHGGIHTFTLMRAGFTRRYEFLAGITDQTIQKFADNALEIQKSVTLFSTLALNVVGSMKGRGFKAQHVEKAVGLALEEKTLKRRDEDLHTLADSLHGISPYPVRPELLDIYYKALRQRGIQADFISCRDEESPTYGIGNILFYSENGAAIQMVGSVPSEDSLEDVLREMIFRDHSKALLGFPGDKDINLTIGLGRAEEFIGRMRSIAIGEGALASVTYLEASLKQIRATATAGRPGFGSFDRSIEADGPPFV